MSTLVIEEDIASAGTSNASFSPQFASPNKQIVNDPRSFINSDKIVYKNLHQFRVQQMNRGVNTLEMNNVQWGLTYLEKCHHISTTNTTKDGPQSYRVRICKTCCQEQGHIELGTYVDQESAILMNDVFEILNQRTDKLIVLRKEDQPDLPFLMARKYDRFKGKDCTTVLELISERLGTQQNDLARNKRKSPSVSSENSSKSRKLNPRSSYSSSSSVTSEESISRPTSELRKEGNQEDIDNDFDDEEESNESHAVEASKLKSFQSLIDQARLQPDLTEVKVSSPKQIKTEASSHNEVRFGDCASPIVGRYRSYTFSTTNDFTTAQLNSLSYNVDGRNPIETLTWLATLDDDEVNVAKSLFDLGKNTETLQSEDEQVLSPTKTLLKFRYDTSGMDSFDNSNHHSFSSYPAGLVNQEMYSMFGHNDGYGERQPMLNYRRRGRSSSMSLLEGPMTTPASLSIYPPPFPISARAKDPLSIALKKFAERGGVKGEGYIGIYSPEDRKDRIVRFLEKRKHRMWTKKVKYDVRKNFADSRIRVKGRFVKKEDEEKAVLEVLTGHNVSGVITTPPGAPALSAALGRRSYSSKKKYYDDDEEDDEEDEDED